MFEFLDNIRIGFFIIGDTLLFLLLINLISETISEIREGDKIEKELREKRIIGKELRERSVIND